MSVQDYELLLRVRADLNQAIKGLDSVRGQLDRGTQSAERFARQGNLSVTAMRALGAAITAAGVARLAKEYLDAADASSNMAAKLRLVTDSADQQVAVQKALFAQAQQTRSSYEGQVELYVRLAQSSDQLRKNQSLLLDMTKLVSQTLVLSGADTAAAEGAVRQFAQAMASGTLRGDEFNSVMEASPRLAQAVADGLNVPKGALRQLAAQGKLTADQVIAALTSQREAIDREFGSLPLTVGGAVQQVRNSLLNLVGDADGATGASKELAQSISGLSETLQSPEVKAGLQALITGLVSVARFAAEAAAALGGFGKATIDAFSDDQQKSYDGLLQKRLRLEDELSDRRLLHQDEAAKRIENEIALLDKLIEARRKAMTAPPAPPPAPAPASGNGVIDAGTVTVFGEKPEVAAQRAAQAAQAMAAANEKLRGVVDALRAQTLGPAAKIWDDYAKAVRNAAEAGGDAIATGADVAQVQQQVADAVRYAAELRDKALGEESDKARQAYEQLRETLRTPMEAALEQAIAQVRELNAALDAGIIKPEEYRQQLARIGQASVLPAPDYQGVAPEVGGISSEIDKNLRAQQELAAWHEQALKANEAFRQQDTASEEAYQAGLAAIQAQYAQRRQVIEQSRQTLTLQAASNFFGNLSQLSTSHNKTMARIGKTAAIMQTTINTYQSATEAYKALAGIPYIGPALGIAAAAAAVAAGLANVQQIRSQNASFSGGGYTGDGGKYQPAGVVHAGEVVHRQEVVKQPGALPFLLDFNQRGMAALYDYADRLHGFAEGGLVGPMPSTAGFASPRLPAPAVAAPGQGGKGSGRGVRIINVPDKTGLKDYVTSSEDEEVIVNVIGRNKSDVRALLGI